MNPQPRRSRGKRLLLTVAFTALLVGSAFVLYPRMDDGRSLGTANADGLTYDSVAHIQGVASGPLPGDVPVGPLGEGAQAQLEEAIAAALSEVDAAVAAASDAAVPSDYTVGATVEAPIVGYVPVSYRLPDFPAVPSLGDVGLGIPGLPGPVETREGLGLPAGVGGAPDPVQVLEDALASLGQGGALGPLDGVLGGLGGVPDPQGTLDGLVGGTGLLPDSDQAASDAEGAADPDEAGAQLSFDHADLVLGTAMGAYGEADEGLDGLTEAYAGLAHDVEGVLADTQDTAAEAEAKVHTILEERLAALQAEAEGVQADAYAAALADRALLDEVQARAEANVLGTLEAQEQAVADLAAERLAAIDAAVAAATEEAGARIATVEAEVDAATGDLAELEASTGAGQAANVAAVRAAGEAAISSVEDQLAEVQAQAEAAAAEVQAEADATVASLQAAAAQAVADVQDRSGWALAETLRVESYAQALAESRLAQLAALEQAVADHAVGEVQAAAEAHAEEVVATALQATGQADGLLAAAESLVGELAGVTMDSVEADVAYIEGVSEDYGRVPTPERKESATYWAGVAADVASDAGRSLALGEEVLGSAEEMAAAAALAQSRLTALA